MLPLYEGKMGNIFDHRFASFTGTGDTDIVHQEDHSATSRVLPRYWVTPESASERQGRRTWGTDTALLGFRRVARNTDERTCIAALLPWYPASYGWILSAGPGAEVLAFLCAQYNSFVFDFVLRQFLSQPSVPLGTFEQLPTVDFARANTRAFGLDNVFRWASSRSVELSATETDLVPLAMATGDSEAPHGWDRGKRQTTRAELDAAFFHLFGIERDDVDYIMETFPIVKSKDIAEHGEYRTKRLILEIYDEMAQAEATGVSYASPFDKGHKQ